MTRLPHVVLLVALALGVGACGDDREPSSEPAPAAVSETASESTTDLATEPTTAPASSEPPSEPTTEPTTEPTVGPAPTVTPTDTPTEVPPASEPDEPAGPGPTTYDEALARFDAAGQEPQRLKRFESTTGVYCLLDSDFLLGCELPAGGGVPDPEFCGEGPSEKVGRVVLGPGVPEPECNNDTIREPGAPRLDVGSVAASRRTGVQCLLTDDGVTCLDTERRQGFYLGSEQYAVFSG